MTAEGGEAAELVRPVRRAATAPVPALSGVRSRIRDYADLMKVRLTSLVVVTAAAGYLLASGSSLDVGSTIVSLLGVFLLSGGAAGLNQILEVGPDSRMLRTRARPLPAGRLSPRTAFVFSLSLLVLGAILLARAGSPLAAELGCVSAVIYVLIYTPMKRVTTLNTLVGAVVGALPPVMGWAAASGRVGPGAIVLAGILFVWQIPHFLAIAWMYREDYSRGGFRMLPVSDRDGRVTFLMVLLYSLSLLPVSLAAAMIRPTGWLYPVGASVLGVGFVLLAAKLYRERTRAAARQLFLASLAYLPLLFALLALDPTGPLISRIGG